MVKIRRLYENENERLSAKIRNQLGPYWSLISMIKKYEDTGNQKLWEYILESAKLIEENQDRILELIDSIDDKNI